MVGLLPDRPQRGKSKLKDLKGVANGFEALFDAHCRNVEHRRVTGEKALQSYLIREAQKNNRRLVSLNSASATTDEPVEAIFVTDEISLPLESGRTVCDVLAIRRDGGRCTPILLELKDSRHLTRLLAQVDSYAALVDAHAELFAELFSALLGEVVHFDASTEKWIVWPSAGVQLDAQDHALRSRGVRYAGYAIQAGSYRFTLSMKPKKT
jgi:hypothetical protein